MPSSDRFRRLTGFRGLRASEGEGVGLPAQSPLLAVKCWLFRDLAARVALSVPVAVLAAPACGLISGSTEAVTHPEFENGGLIASAARLQDASAVKLDGIWAASEGSDLVGDLLVVHHSPGHISAFGGHDAIYAVLTAGCLADGRLVLEGYYRAAASSLTGLVRLFVEPPQVAHALCQGQVPAERIRLVGAYGEQTHAPDHGLSLQWSRSWPELPTTAVIAHRGGCRTSDDCGASENSLEMLRMAQRLGADRVEIDVQVTQDSVPVVYHDAEFGPLLTNGPYCRGAVEDFAWAHVTQLCELRYGEAVPRLEDALRTIVDETELSGVWLDVKTVVGMKASLPLVREWNRIAEERQRDLQIVVGLSTEELVDAWLALREDERTECLLELEVGDLERTGCHVWAPRWTLGPMPATVARVQAEGRSVAFWTLDDSQFIERFIEEASPRGILTNRPGLVLYQATMDGIRRQDQGSP